MTGCFFANNVFMISRPDIYNIPILAATAFLTAGCALYLKAADFKGKGDTAAACLGSFCLAATAGCRPQLLLYALPMLVLIMIQYVKKQGFDRKRIPALFAIFLPWVVMAIPVCVYNHARFGSVFDFGATYSLTSNDMNHRGFNAERLVRGLYCFLFQPPVYTTDFPYLKSSILKSSYMGKNLVEFTFGGIFAAIPLTLAVFFPFFGAGKKMGRQEKCIWQCLLLSSLVIAAFDVNNAGILYRYTCDLAPGMLYASMLVWIVLAGREKKAGAVGKVLPLLMVFSICFAFLVFVAGGDAINIHDGNPSLYEHIRSYF